ncbi:MAG: hypothetical protein QME58_00890 [Bacteroidota bacterium]|nr:hypothetical protein [Bacteroidota bacterium]
MMFRIFLCLTISVAIQSLIFSQSKKIKSETQTSHTQGANGILVPDRSVVVKHYDEKGKIVSESNQRFWEEIQKEITYDTKYFYNSEELLDSSILFEGENVVLKLVYEFDTTGTVIGAVEILPDGKSSFRTKYFYNDKKLKVREIISNPEGVTYTEKEYSYNNKGKLIEEKGKDRGTPRYKWLFKYDMKNILVERKMFDGNGNLIRTNKYENNNDGKPVKETESSPGSPLRIIKYKYIYY